jgi:tRNA(Ile)-lysidine synthase
MDLLQYIKTFAKKYFDPKRPVLLGYSGGTDSSVLFELFHAAKISFIAAHVDHGWRETSAEEALLLAQRTAAYNIPFYSTRLNLQNLKGNLEEISREKRYSFFKELVEKHNAQAVCLAHHRDDQVETTLTRLLQGYSLHHLSGMSTISQVHGITVIRPLLEIPKGVLLEYPLKHSAIEDYTNHDPRFLRARLRQLQEGLGKEIKGPLTRISKESDELKQFLAQHLNPILQTIEPICCGSWLNLSTYKLSRLEYRFLLKEFLRKADVIFSHHLIESALEAMEAGKANHTIQGNKARLIVDRRHLFLDQKIPTVEWQEVVGPELLGWKAFLRGQLTIAVDDSVKIVPCTKHASDLWNACHVPAFLRSWVPMLETKDGKTIELISGRPSKLAGRKFLRLNVL